jgi:hypothetical protein
MRSFFFLVLAAATLAAPVRVMAASGGSIYSLLGIGDLRPGYNVRAAGMGYAGSTLLSSQYLNIDAPATWADLSLTRLEAGVQYEGFSSSNGTASRYLASLDFQGASIGIPISSGRGITLAAGIEQYSRVNYDTYFHGTGFSSTDSIPYANHFSGSGGINIGKLGLSYKPLHFLAIGASFDYYFGTIERHQLYNPSSSSFAGANVIQSSTYRGAGTTLQVLFNDLESIAPALKPLTIGFTINSRTVLSSDNQTYYEFGADVTNLPTSFDTSAQTSGQIVIPLSYTVGASYLATDRVLIAVDYSTRLWRHASVEGAFSADLRNEQNIGFGMERLPNRDPNTSWGEHIALRLGFLYHSTYYRPDEVGINEWLVTGGMTLPLSLETRLHIAAEYGIRGVVTNGLLRDKVFRLSAAFSIGELWFVRPDVE